MATTKIVNQSILFPTAKNVDIATKIEFLYCFASEILSKQLLDGVHFAIQDGGPKSFPFKWKHWFLVSERSQLSKNVFGYNSPQKSSESFFLDVATLTSLTPLLILIFSLSLCRCTVTELSVYMSFRISMYTSSIPCSCNDVNIAWVCTESNAFS